MKRRMWRILPALVLAAALAEGAHDEDIPFRHVVVDRDGPVDMHAKTIGDLDGDGFDDLIVSGTKGLLVWYQYPDWKKRVINSGSGGWSCDLRVADVDRDGHNDVIASDWYMERKLVWFRNPGRADADWKMNVIGNIRAHDIAPADLNRDGRIDVVTRQQGKEGGHLELWIQGEGGGWQHRTLDCPLGEGLAVADLDRDGDPDILTGNRWYENSGDALRGPWTEHVIAAAFSHPDVVPAAADINRDGRLDIVLMPAEKRGQRYRAAWFEAPADPRQGNWTEHLIEADLEAVHHALAVADMDRDGDLDIVTAEMHQGEDPDEVKIYLNLDGKGHRWRKQVVATTGSHNIRVVDTGRKGALDIFGANWSTSSQVDLWVNQSAASKPGER